MRDEVWTFLFGMVFPKDEEQLDEPCPLINVSRSSSPEVIHWKRLSNKLLETCIERDSFSPLPGKQEAVYNHLAISNPLPF